MYIKATWRDHLFNTFNVLLLLAFTLICAYPLWYIGINSISSSQTVAEGVFLFPRELSFDSYRKLAQIPAIGNSVLISTARTLAGTLLSVFCSAFLGYLITNRDLPFRKFIYRFFIITMYFNAGFIPYYLLMKNLGLKNNFLLYVIPGAVSAFFLILVKTYIESLPASLEEAAKIDGAGIVLIFTKVILPLCLPILACCAVFSAVGQWNSWADNMFLVSDKRLQTLQFLLYQYLQSNMAEAMRSQTGAAGASVAASIKTTPQVLRLTFTFVTIIPILCVYPFMQKYFVKGIMMGAVKG